VVIADISEDRDTAATELQERGFPALALPLDTRVSADHERVMREMG
jgi:hypothetical protein